MFAAGELVVYGGEGVCRVEGVGTPSLPGMDKTRLYYTLAPLYRSGQVMTPVDTRVLMRPLLTGQEVQELIAQLDQLPELQAFAGKLEQACLDTLNAGVMTKDLVNLVDDPAATQAVTSGEFIAAVRRRLEQTL